MHALFDDSVGSVTDLLPEVVHVQVTAVWRCKLVRVHEGPGLRIMESCRCPVEGAIERVAIGTGLVGCCHHEVIAVVHPAVEEGVAHQILIVLMMLVLLLSVLKSLSVFLQLACE